MAGAWGCDPAAADAAPWGRPGFLHCATAARPPGVQGVSGGEWWPVPRAHVPPSPAQQRDSLPECQLPRGSVSKRPRRCLRTATAKRGARVLVPGAWVGRVCVPITKGSHKAASWGQDPHGGSKPGSLRWSGKRRQSLVLPTKGWEGREEVAACRLSGGGARLPGLSCPQPWRSRGSQLSAGLQAGSWVCCPLNVGKQSPFCLISMSCSHKAHVCCLRVLDACGSETDSNAETSLTGGAEVKPSLCSLTAKGKTVHPFPGAWAALVLPDLTAKQGLRFLAAPVSVLSCAVSPSVSGGSGAPHLSPLPCAASLPAGLCPASSAPLYCLLYPPGLASAISQIAEAAPAPAPVVSLVVLSLSLSV